MCTDRREEGGRSASFFMSFSSVYDTVAINKRSAEQRLFIRSISQSGLIKKPMKSRSANCGLCLSVSGRVFACEVIHQSRTLTRVCHTFAKRISLNCVVSCYVSLCMQHKTALVCTLQQKAA